MYDPAPSSPSQYYWASSPSYSLVVVELLDSQSELLLVELLLPSRVLLTSTLEDVVVLLIRCGGVLRLEVEAVVEIGDGWGSERVKLLIEVTRGQLRELIFRDVCGPHPGVLFLHPLDLAHRKVPPLLGED